MARRAGCLCCHVLRSRSSVRRDGPISRRGAPHAGISLSRWGAAIQRCLRSPRSRLRRRPRRPGAGRSSFAAQDTAAGDHSRFGNARAVRSVLVRFAIDSFVIIPRSIDAIWSLPARKSIDWESARYYVPPIFFGWLLASSIRAHDTRGIIVAIFSIIAFRSAAGRCSWSHTRYGLPLFAVAVVAFIFQPLMVKRRWIAAAIAALPLIVLIEIFPNAIDATKLIAGWRARQTHA